MKNKIVLSDERKKYLDASTKLCSLVSRKKLSKFIDALKDYDNALSELCKTGEYWLKIEY